MTVLVGRDDLLRDLGTALEHARAGRGGLVIITGDAGLGKTTLAAEAVAAADGFRTVWSWCAASPAGDSLRPWLQVVRALAAADADAARLVDASPWLSGLLGGQLPSTDATSETHRWQLFDALADLVRGASRTTPLLIVLDDLHDAQASSLWLLAHLAATLRSCAVLVLATARDSEHAWHAHTEARAALHRQATMLRPAPFSQPQIGELLPDFTARDSRDAAAARILARTGGNPLLVIELIQSLGAQPSLEADALATVVPASVRAITVERLLGCSTLGRRVLEAAAVLGTRFALDTVAELITLDLSAARRALGEAEAVGVVEFPEPGTGRFVHELVRDAVYDGLAPADRSASHERAARVLALAAERGRAIPPAEIAHHYLRAGVQASDKAARLAALAGDRAMELLAFEDAAAWYEQALRVLDGADVDAARRATIALSLGEARRGAGDRAGARERFLQAAALAQQCDRTDILARAALGLGSGSAGFEVQLLDREQLDLLEEAHARLPEEQPVLRGLVMARLSVALTAIDSDERRLALATEAVHLARIARDDAAHAAAVAALCDALAGPEHTAQRLAYASDIVACAGRVHDPALELLGRRLRLVSLLESGDRAAAEDEITAYRIRAETFRHPLYTWYLPLWRAMWALAEGRFDDCRALNDLAHVEGDSAGSHNAFLLWITQRWCLLAENGPLAELRALYSTVDFDREIALWARVSSTLFTAQLGDLVAARRGLDVVAPRLSSLPRDSEWLACLAQVAETIALVGPHPAARWVYDALEPFADLFVVEGIGAAIRGPVQRFLGLAASALGDATRAEAHFAHAVAAARKFGAPGLVERIQRDQRSRRPPDEPVDVGEYVFRRTGDVWTIRYGARELQLRDSKGLQDLAVLLARPTVDVGALDLIGARTDGDAGEVLDAAARDAYRRRLMELEADAADADADADAGRSSQIAAERDALLQQLTAAYGLGGRARRVGSDAERARTAVTARIRDTIRRIESAYPDLGRHLSRSVRTGTFCVYTPDPPISWRT